MSQSRAFTDHCRQCLGMGTDLWSDAPCPFCQPAANDRYQRRHTKPLPLLAGVTLMFAPVLAETLWRLL